MISKSLNSPKPANQAGADEVPEEVLELALETWHELKTMQRVRIAGHSMIPTIRPGDTVMVQHGALHLRRGDVVVLRLNDRLVAHRIIDLKWQTGHRVILTKGDNNPRFDAPCNADAIIGRVLAVQHSTLVQELTATRAVIRGRAIAYATLFVARPYGTLRTLKQRLMFVDSLGLDGQLVTIVHGWIRSIWRII
jgi:signal peptidase I